MILPLLVGCIFSSLKSVSIYEKSGKTEYHDPMIWEMRCPIILLGYLSSGSCKENRPWLSALALHSHRRGISSDKVWPKTQFLRLDFSLITIFCTLQIEDQRLIVFPQDIDWTNGLHILTGNAIAFSLANILQLAKLWNFVQNNI